MVDAGAAPIDRYVVLEHLSEGGMGAIYVGKKLGAGGFEMEVVLKQLLPEFTQQEEFIDLFLREAKLSATLDHANIVHTIDLVTAGNEYFIVMEYLPGGDLRTLLKRAKRRGKRFSPAAAIYICREVLSALSYAHAKRDFGGQPLKLIHRDVSPSNILVSNSGEVKLTDFGIAKAATHTSLFYKVKGKIGYMSPEQARSETLDSRSDLYSLAVCLYEVITGERLFIHAGLTTSADEIYSQPIPVLSKKVPNLAPELDAIMAKALAISADERYQTAGEFQEALARCAHRNGLLMSAPELANELLTACGPREQWRDEGEDEELPYVQRAGTEIIGPDADDDDEEAHEAALQSMARLSASMSRPKTEIGKLQGVELTSIINMMDIEGAPPPGSKPLVDFAAASPLPAPLPQSAPHELAPQLAPPLEPQLVTKPLPMPVPPHAPGTGAKKVDPTTLIPRAPLPAPRKRGFFRSWMFVVLVLIAAGVAGVVIAMSGPTVHTKKDKPNK